MLLALLAAVTVTFHPARPTVGDPIAIRFEEPVRLDASADFEIVEQKGNEVVIRTFASRPLTLSGTAGSVRFRNLRIPVVSVLKKNDDLKPAPLAPPRPVPWPRLPWIAIGIAALFAIAAWSAVAFLSRRRARPRVPIRSPAEAFRDDVEALRGDRGRKWRWAALADATRSFLAATRPSLGSELTTSELLPRLHERERIVESILRQGDLEKFSTRGPAPADFERVADEALALAVPPPEVEKAP